MRDIGLFIWVGILILGVVSSIAKSAKRQQQAPSRHRARRSRCGRWRPAALSAAQQATLMRVMQASPRNGAKQAPPRPGAPAPKPAATSAATPRRRRPATRPNLRARAKRRLFGSRAGAASAPSSQPRCSASQKPLTTNIFDSLTQRSIDLHELSDRVRLFGEYDRNLSAIESSLDVAVHADGDKLLLAGDDAAVARAERVVRRVLDAAVGGAHITPDDVKLALTDSASPSESGALTHTLMRTHRGREVRPRTPGSASSSTPSSDSR